MISEDRLQKALTFLAETDEKVAVLKADVERMKYKRDTVLAIKEAYSQAKTQAERQRDARMSTEYCEWVGENQATVQAYETLKNKRATEALIVEVWRSLNSARKAGII